ncbi:uncharacterized protein LOC110179177 [Drosophila serrata]|uniref:uncharacterized protein LOC110179177 n=1 Tax=Drosophila serrata TaxID=7274 RepID=UPI000A1CFB77|nr:uncharacterized protein LOC110179177 [Drosophila serrata]
MRQWNYIIFLILLVPRIQAHEENITNLFREIDDYYGTLKCYDGMIKEPLVIDVKEFQDEIFDFSTLVNAYVRYNFLKTLLNDTKFAKSCINFSASNDGKAKFRTFGLITEIWKEKLCYVLHMLDHCMLTQPNVIEEIHIHPPPIAPKPEQQHATCTPIEEYVLLPSGKLEKQKQLKCVFTNQTSVIVPMVELENDSKTPKIITAPPGGRVNINGKPEVMIIQDVKVNVDSTRRP